MESQIEKLRQKYWAGKTSVEEEKILRKHFGKKNSSKNETAYFKEIEKRKSRNSSLEFSQPHRKIEFAKIIATIAASIIILLAVTLGLEKLNNKNQYTIDDPQKAYEISKQALMLVSTELNKGKVYSSKMNKINKVKNINK